MAVTLAANAVVSGELPGSPVKQIDKMTMGHMQSVFSQGIQISPKAQVGDVVWGAISLTGTVTVTGLSIDSPFVFDAGNTAFNPSDNTRVTFAPFHAVVTSTSQIGRYYRLSWAPTLNQYSVNIGLYTLRYVDTVTIFDVTSVYATSGTTPVTDTAVPPITPVTDGAFIIGLITAEGGGAPATWLTLPTGTPDMLNITDWNTVLFSPNISTMNGIIDAPKAQQFLGGHCTVSLSTGAYAQIFVNYVGITLAFRPTPAPGAPTLTVTSGGTTVPSGGHADAAQQSGAPFSAIIAYTPVRGQGTQEAFLIGREWNSDGSHTGYWNADDMVWSTTEYWNYRTPTQGATTFTYTFPPSAWADDGTVWKLKVAVKENKLHYSSALSSGFVFTAQAPAIVLTPTVTGTGPKPTVNWTETLDSGASQASWRVRIFTLAQTTATGFDPNVTVPIKDSGYTTGTALTWTLTTSLASGTAYKAYVQVSDSRGMVSNWAASASFTPSYSQPGAGSLVVVLSP